jgi:hypothetical protein
MKRRDNPNKSIRERRETHRKPTPLLPVSEPDSPAFKISRAEMERELLALMLENTRNQLIANAVVNSVIRRLRMADSTINVLCLSMLASILAVLVTIGLNELFSQTTLGILPLILIMSGLTGFSLSIVKILHDIILPPNARALMSYILDETGLITFSEWFRSFLSLPKQLITSLLLSLLMIVSLFVIERNTTVVFGIGTYILMFFAIFVIGQGAYSAVMIPTIVRAATKERMKLFWLHPTDSPAIKMASSAFAKLSMADAAIVTICLIAMYWFKPWESPDAAIVSGIWLLIGLSAVSYSFLYPHYYLSKAIKAEKERQMLNLQAIISSFQSSITELSEEDLKRLAEFNKLYDQLSATRESAIDTRAFRGFLTSLAVPTLSFLGGLLDLGQIFGFV